MRLRLLGSLLLISFSVVIIGGCGRPDEASPTVTPNRPAEIKEPGPLPASGFKAEIALVDPPTRLRTGQKENLRVKIKNVSDVVWWARGGPVNTRPDNKFYIAAGNRWLKADGSLLTNMDGRYGITKDIQPGEESEVPLAITAPKEPGEYTLEVDLLQEQVSWFSDKGSSTAKTKITVVR